MFVERRNLLNNILLIATAYSASVDCPNLINLAQGLEIQSQQATIWTQLNGDCCFADGVVCDINQRVTQITWNSKGLGGFINGTAIPPGVTILNLNTNNLFGSIPNMLPIGLVTLKLDKNQLTGDFPNSLPTNLIDLDISVNKLTGNILNLPNNLVLLSVEGNQLNGILPTFPLTLQYVYLGYPGYPGNHFTGTLRLKNHMSCI